MPTSGQVQIEDVVQVVCDIDPVAFGDVLGRKPESEFCKRTMGVVRYLLATLRSDPAAKEIFLTWANRC